MTPRPKRIAWILAAVVLAALVWWAFQPLLELFEEPQGVIATSQQRRVGGGKEAGLEIVAWVERNRVLKEEPPFKVWFRVANLDASPIKDLRLTLYGPGFKLSPSIHAVGLADTKEPDRAR